LIPYFPASYNDNQLVFALGLEYPDLLVNVLRGLREEKQADDIKDNDTPVDWDRAFDAMLTAVQRHVDIVTRVANDAARDGGIPFAGLDSSPAPSKDVASLCEVFELLGVKFGGPGTIQCASYLTRLFKSVRGVNLVGFSGLMLTCLEDAGMAAAAINSDYNITALLAYSAVCGIGLDCVPVPGDVTVAQLAALMSDTGTLAFRLNKPLTVRLFPCPGLKAGDMTQFDSPDLVNCTVFAV